MSIAKSLENIAGKKSYLRQNIHPSIPWCYIRQWRVIFLWAVTGKMNIGFEISLKTTSRVESAKEENFSVFSVTEKFIPKWQIVLQLEKVEKCAVYTFLVALVRWGHFELVMQICLLLKILSSLWSGWVGSAKGEMINHLNLQFQSPWSENKMIV